MTIFKHTCHNIYAILQAIVYAILAVLSIASMYFSGSIHTLLTVLLNNAHLEDDVLSTLLHGLTEVRFAMLSVVLGSMLFFFFASRFFKSLGKVEN